MVDPSVLLLLAVVLPWLVAGVAMAMRGRPRLRELVTVVGGLIVLGVVWRLVPTALAGMPVVVSPVEFVAGVSLAFRADAAAVFFALVVSALWPLATVYSAGYLQATDAHSRTRFFVAFAASVATVLGVAFAANLLTLFVFYELLTVATYPLVVHAETDAARQAGKKYLAYTLTGGVAVLGGTVLVYAATGTVGFDAGGILAMAAADPVVASAAFVLLTIGFGVKAALMPLHGWLPDAMVAPTPVSGLLHAVAVVKSGVFGIARVVLYVFGPDEVAALGIGLPLAAVAAVTMTVAGLVALRQDRLKRALAYSTVSQLSYIVLGLAVLTPKAVQGAFLHISAHAFMKIALFFCAGIIYAETHVERIVDLRGIARRLPATTTAFAIASAGLVGLPLVAGFVSKWYLLVGLFDGGYVVFAGVLLLAGLLKLLLFWPIVSSAFDTGAVETAGETSDPLHTDGGHISDHAEAGADTEYTDWESRTWRTETDLRLLLPVLVAVAVAVALGVVPTSLPFYDLAERIAEVTLA